MIGIMNRNVAVYIPSAYRKEINKVTKQLAEKFGGTIKTEGVSDEKEDVTVIRAWYVEKEHEFIRAFMLNLALEVKVRCKQDCVAMEFEGEMYIV